MCSYENIAPALKSCDTVLCLHKDTGAVFSSKLPILTAEVVRPRDLVQPRGCHGWREDALCRNFTVSGCHFEMLTTAGDARKCVPDASFPVPLLAPVR